MSLKPARSCRLIIVIVALPLLITLVGAFAVVLWIPDQIESVSVVTVDPIGEFGGYGWRRAPDGRSGIVLSTGDAIEVRRMNGKRFVGTMHDAAVLAAVAQK